MLKMPVLMYHNVTTNDNNSIGLTISISKFEEQLQYLVKKNFSSYFVSEIYNNTNIKGKGLIITFDDVTENQLLYAIPLLKKYNFKATFFIPFSYLGKTDLWNEGLDATGEKIMTIDQLKSIDPNIIEFAHHSFLHKKYSTLTHKEIQEDFDKSFELISKNDLNVFPVLAYPYGNYPKKGNHKTDFFKILEKNNIKMAFRIGNKINKFPFKNPYEIKRLDILGQDKLWKFKLKLIFGKLKLF